MERTLYCASGYHDFEVRDDALVVCGDCGLISQTLNGEQLLARRQRAIRRRLQRERQKALRDLQEKKREGVRFAQATLSRHGRLWALYGDRCRYCGDILTDTTRTIDHIVPRHRGGTNHPENLHLACAWCNHRKANNPVEWLMADEAFQRHVRSMRKRRGIHPDGDGYWHSDLRSYTDQDDSYYFVCHDCGGSWCCSIEAKQAKCARRQHEI